MITLNYLLKRHVRCIFPEKIVAKKEIASISSRQSKAVSANCPRSCPTLSTPQEPVCGTDGLIYANVCEMKKKTCSRNGVVGVKVCGQLCFPEIRSTYTF